MQVFRIVAEKYAEQLTASGAANRWNHDGAYVIYCASSRALATLELIVHRVAIRSSLAYKMLAIEIKDPSDMLIIQQDRLPENWRSVKAYADLQSIGQDWYTARERLVMQIPSAIIPQEFNYVINTRHPDFDKKVKIVARENYFWDERLKLK